MAETDVTVDSEAFLEWFKSHAKSRKCSVCDSAKWHLFDKPLEMRPFSGGGLVLGGAIVPLVMLTCTTCSHVLLFNALISGAIPPKPAPAEAEGAPK